MSTSFAVRPPVRVVRVVLGLSLIWSAGIRCGGGDGTGPSVGINSSARSVSFSGAPGGSVDPKTISVTPSSGQLTGLTAAVTFVSPSGAPPWLTASFAGTTATLDAPGVLTLQVTNTDLPPDAYTATITVSADNAANAPKVAVSFTIEGASALVLTTQPSATATSGAPLGQAPVVQLQTASGVPVAQAGVVVGVALEGSGTLTGPASVITDAQGAASFDGLVITALSGEQTLLFTATDLAEVRSNPIAIVAGAAARLSANSITPQSAEAGTPVNEPPIALVTDEAGNPIAGVAVTFAVTGGGGVISPTTPITTADDGTAALTSWQLGAIAGANTVTATAPGLTGSPLEFAATGTNGGVVPGPVSGAQSSVSASPSTFTAGGSGTTVTVTARDADNNLIGGATVTLSSSGSNFTFGSTSLTTGTNGLTLGKATTTYTSTKAEVKSISAQISLGGPPVSPTPASVTVTAGAPSASTSTVTATTPVVGLANTSTVTVTVKDANGNPVAGRTVTLAITSGAGGTITQPSSTTSPTGVTQGSLGSTTGGAYQVQATVAGGTPTVISQIASTTILVSFANDIEPVFTQAQTDRNGILTTACSSCHLPTSGGSVPDLSFAHLTDAHDAGVVVAPGNADGSLLIAALEHTLASPTEQMPSLTQFLPVATIDLIRRWINQNGLGQPLQP